jgi:hypothetical protein
MALSTAAAAPFALSAPAVHMHLRTALPLSASAFAAWHCYWLTSVANVRAAVPRSMEAPWWTKEKPLCWLMLPLAQMAAT